MGMPKSDPIGYDMGHGLWRSLVARCTGGAKVAGSNPVSPTISQQSPSSFSAVGFLLESKAFLAFANCL